MTSQLWARRIYLLGIVLSVLLFVPQASFPIMTGKVAAAAVCFLIAGLLWAWGLWQGTSRAPSAASLVFLLLPLSYLLSFAFSADRALGLVGAGIDADSLLMIALLSAAGMLGSALFSTAAEGVALLRTLMWTAVAAALFQCVVLAGVLPGPFADRSVNLVGKWNDFSILLSLLGLMLMFEIEFTRLSSRMRLGGWVGLVVVLVLLAMVNFAVAWGLLLAAALVLLALAWGGARRGAWTAALAGIVAAVFLFFGAALNAQLSKVIPLSSLEVRPSLQSTFDVTSAAHGASVKAAALGTGPNTFGLSWLAHKPAEVNQSAFWNLDFVVGFSTLATAFSSTGLLGAVAWLSPLVLVLAGLWRSRRQEHWYLALAFAGMAVAWWAVIALYVPSQNLLLVAFATAGAALGLMWPGRLRGIAGWVAAALVVALLVWCGVEGARRFAAEYYVGSANAALASGDTAAAQALSTRSVSIEATPENLRLLTGANAAALQALATQPAGSSTQQDFTDLLQKTISAGQRAIALDAKDYRSFVTLGQVYALLAANKVQGAYDSTKQSYAQAAALSPLNPTIPLLSAQLEASAGTLGGLQAALKQSLTLKPDYTDAILFLAQVDIARNDLESAINDTKLAVQSAPGVASVWLQLGLLYYAGGDTQNAIPPLEQALKIQPGYANAQYFLGLSYAAQGRAQDALALFEQLIVTNPNNTQVQGVLANLRAGKAPFASSTPATTTR